MASPIVQAIKQICEEMKYEQPLLYGTFQSVAKRAADQIFDEGKQPNKHRYIMKNYMFLGAFVYKCISVSIETKWMEEDIRL